MDIEFNVTEALDKLADADDCHNIVGIIQQVFDEIYEG